MLRKFTLALVAAASLSAMALAPSAASAHPWGGKWGGGFGGFHNHFGHGFGINIIAGGGDDGCYVTQRVPTPFGYRSAPSTSADIDRTSGSLNQQVPVASGGRGFLWVSLRSTHPQRINTQPRGPKFKKDFRQAEVTKMIKVYGAPIDDADVPKIVDYLAATY
jgi:hypothetical protein